jgi:predicted phosphoserine aminotransferase
MARLFIPGPTDVHPDVLTAQTRPLIGHRGAEFTALFGGLQEKLRRIFQTAGPVFVSTSSGTGLQEAAVRNCISRRVLCCANGAFAERFRDVAQANGKQAVTLSFPWGQAVKPEAVLQALAAGGFDALTVVHNETSTGVVSRLDELAVRVRERFPEVLLLVDAVSSLGGDRLDFDALGLDVLLTSSQKCLAAPPGLALAAVSERALARARRVEGRGVYFDFLEFEKNLAKRQTPTTPAITLVRALDAAADRILAEGLTERFERHAALAARVQAWAAERHGLFAEEGFRSRTVTCVRNVRGVEVKALNAFLKERGMQLSDGYGPIKGKTFRIAHMGEIGLNDLEQLLAAVDAFCAGSR